MLEPHNRRYLIDALRPPLGYRLDYAIGTTFTLDLLALLTAPLAFTVFDWEDGEDRPARDPQALLAALSQFARRMSLFCQVGRIAVPAEHRLLFSYLEGSVIEVNAPRRGGIFHPKVWALRFVSPGRPVVYRLLCASRNLTFDRSWDTLLVLDGEVVERQKAFGLNNPLGDFVAALPGLAIHPVANDVRGKIDQIQDEIRRVQFAPPDGLTLKAFWPLGLGRRATWPFSETVDRWLVVSPFLSADCLQRLAGQGQGHILISRVDSLDAVNQPGLARFARQYVLRDAATPEDTTEPRASGQDSLSGLHAKLYVADAGQRTRLWTGSANATGAAFGANVEFLVELEGERSVCGIDALLRDTKGSVDLIDLLQLYSPPDVPMVEDETETRLAHAIDEARRRLVAACLTARVEVVDDDVYKVTILSQAEAPLVFPPDVEVVCWPISLSAGAAVPMAPDGAEVAAFKALSFAALTSFFAFEVTARRRGRSSSDRFVLNLPLDGAPADREERLLRTLLSDRNQVLRLLLLLLADDPAEVQAALTEWVSRNGGQPNGAARGLDIPLLEVMVRALATDPGKLDQVHRVVSELKKSDAGRSLLPDRFADIWDPIWAARQELQQ